jgi:hypothetical protein
MSDIFTHARRRYPDAPGMLAVSMLASDRRHAGLGALDERLRRKDVLDGPRRIKSQDFETRRICYKLTFRQRPQTHIAKFKPVLHFGASSASAVFTQTRTPEITLAIRHWARPVDLTDQDARDALARALWGARRELREAAVEAQR